MKKIYIPLSISSLKGGVRGGFLLSVVCCLLTLTSCTSFLDIKPYGKTVPQSAEEFAALVHSLCNDIDEGNLKTQCLMLTADMAIELESISDNMEVSLTDQAKGRGLRNYIGDITNNMQSMYSNVYALIGQANIVLDNFKGEERNTREGQDIIGTAYALRGICYYQLIRLYCAPPLAEDGTLGVSLVTEFDMEGRHKRSSMAETIQQAESDMKAALNCHIQNEMFRFNDDVMKACLARLYHWCGRWEEARALALEIVEKYPLLEKEEFRSMLGQQYGLNGNIIFKVNRLLSSSTAISSSLRTLNARPYSAALATLYDEKTSDARWNFYFNRKRKTRETDPYLKPMACIRSAEMALIAMEAAYHMGDTETALKELNAFRAIRIAGVEPLTMETLFPLPDNELIRVDCYGKPIAPLLYNILRERRKEMVLCNGDRFFELKRNGRPEWKVSDGDPAGATTYFNEKYLYTFPLYVQDLAVQDDIQQNPGYEITK